MKKLSLRERIIFRMKNKTWLEEREYQPALKYGVMYYDGYIKGWDHVLIYAAQEIKGKMKFTLISKREDVFKSYIKDYEGLYMIGTEGIFYTGDKKTPVEVVFQEVGCEGVLYFPEVSMACIYMKDNKDMIAKMSFGDMDPVVKGKYIVSANGDMARKNQIDRSHADSVKIVLKEDGDEYRYYLVDEKQVLCDKIALKSYEDYLNFLGNKLVKAYDRVNECNILITQVNFRMKVHGQFDEIEEIDENLFLATKENDNWCHVLQYVDEANVVNLGAIPKGGEWSFWTKVFDTRFFKVKSKEGVRIVAIYEGVLDHKFYPGAVDIEFSAPFIFENGNTIGVKPVALYKKVMDD